MQPLVAVGALGGSGTRVVAEILMNLGINLGEVLNEPNDNLIFTALFKNPVWYKASNKHDLIKRLKIFNKFMTGQNLSLNDKIELFKSSILNKTIGRDYFYYYKVFLSKRDSKESAFWGWKEPNTQLYLEVINEFYPKIKYIHVLRNGLDMAFSNNKYQLRNWGFKHNIFLNNIDDDIEMSIKQLDYWIQSTKEILGLRHKFQDRFYLLNYSDFCKNPQNEIENLLNFLGINIDDDRKEKLIQLVNIPNSFERYKKKDISFFRKDQLKYVEKMGFSIN